ncbi:hypothetical protein Lser_V15G45033 [Lactuca serriola]
MSPFEEGEVFVPDDGGETLQKLNFFKMKVDLDLGNYERFLDVKLTRDTNITTGKIYQSVIDKERKEIILERLAVPHITDAIQDWIERMAAIPVDGKEGPPDVCVIELGATIAMPFIEALGQFSYRFGAGNFCLIHVSLVPVLNIVGEQCSGIKKLGEYVESMLLAVQLKNVISSSVHAFKVCLKIGDEGTDCNDANIWCCQFLKNIIVWKVVDTPNPMGSKSKRAEYKVFPVCGLDWMGMKVLYTILHGLWMDQNWCLSRMIICNARVWDLTGKKEYDDATEVIVSPFTRLVLFGHTARVWDYCMSNSVDPATWPIMISRVC